MTASASTATSTAAAISAATIAAANAAVTPDRPATTDGPAAVTVRAVTQHRYGGPETLEVGTIELPTPGPGQVAIDVAAAAVDRGTAHLMTGRPWVIRLMGFGFRRPSQPVPGLDVAGVVRSVGDGVTRFRRGDQVFGIGSGTFADVALADADKLAFVPAGVDLVDAAVSGISCSTALQAIALAGDPGRGARVLVIGASGGVGSFATQLLAGAGAEVTGVASTAKLDRVRAMGAADVIDHTTGFLAQLAVRVDRDGAFDAIIDTGGRHSVRALRRALTPEGTLAIVGGENDGAVVGGIQRQLFAAAWSPFVSQRLGFFVAQESSLWMQRVATALASGTVTPEIDRLVGLDGVADSLARLDAGAVTGKIAVVPALTEEAGR